MAIRTDNSIIVSLANLDQFSNKVEIREYILNQWISEVPATKYRYFVETLSNGNRIYLERPGILNKGCDFVIYIENHILYKNGHDKPPKHDFILEDFRLKKEDLSTQEFQNLISSITDIFNCFPFTEVISHVQNQQCVGESYELILKTIKWFFIEQDITYWSGEGRERFYNALISI